MTKSGYVTLIGRPNAGKSTLMNSVLGTKLSIVTPKAQTTRKRVLGIYSDSFKQIVFFDTPGLIRPEYTMQSVMMGYVSDSLNDADVIVLISDVSKFKSVNNFIPKEQKEFLDKAVKPKILVLNKADLIKDKKEILPIIAEFDKTGIFDEIIPMSALNSTDNSRFMELLVPYLPEGPFYYDPEIISTQPERFFISEIIREKIFSEYSQEIPYSTEVSIAEFKERETGKWYISADIIVERPSQKAIIIGENGNKIKQIGKMAREEIENHLGVPVFLELFVKVREKWRNDKNLLSSYGY